MSHLRKTLVIALADLVSGGALAAEVDAPVHNRIRGKTVDNHSSCLHDQALNTGDKPTAGSPAAPFGVGIDGEPAFGLTTRANSQALNLATAAVRVVSDRSFDCPGLLGKVFDDQNLNGYQDQGEAGIPNVRIATVNGLLVTADAKGRFHVACAALPHTGRGSNFVLKLDEHTLPTGYRLTTENPRGVRVTHGKLMKINFGAALHRVVRMEVTSDAFTDEGKTLKPEWDAQVTALLEQLKEKPSLIRIAHRAEHTAQAAALAADIRQRWEAQDCCYPLTVELEVRGVQP